MNSQNPAESNSVARGNPWDPAAAASPPPFSGFGPETSSQADGSAFGGAPQPHASPPPFAGGPSFGQFSSGGAASPPNGFDARPPAGPHREMPNPSAEAQVVSVHCPVCGHGLKLRREHLGIEGQCVSCGEGIVAVAGGPGGAVVVERIPKVVSPPIEAVGAAESPPLDPTRNPPAGSPDSPPPMDTWAQAPESTSWSETPVTPTLPDAWQNPASGPPAMGGGSAPSAPSQEPAPGTSWASPPTSPSAGPASSAGGDSSWSGNMAFGGGDSNGAPQNHAPPSQPSNWGPGPGHGASTGSDAPPPASPQAAPPAAGGSDPSVSGPWASQAPASATAHPAWGTPAPGAMPSAQGNGFGGQDLRDSGQASSPPPSHSTDLPPSAAAGFSGFGSATTGAAVPGNGAAPGANGFGAAPSAPSQASDSGARQEAAPHADHGPGANSAAGFSGFGSASPGSAVPGNAAAPGANGFGAAPSAPSQASDSGARQEAAPNAGHSPGANPAAGFSGFGGSASPDSTQEVFGQSFGAQPSKADSPADETRESGPSHREDAQKSQGFGFGAPGAEKQTAPADSTFIPTPTPTSDSPRQTAEGNFGNLFASSPSESAPDDRVEDAAASFAALFGSSSRGETSPDSADEGKSTSEWELPSSFGGGSSSEAASRRNEANLEFSSDAKASSPSIENENEKSPASMSEGFSTLFSQSADSPANTPWGGGDTRSSVADQDASDRASGVPGWSGNDANDREAGTDDFSFPAPGSDTGKMPASNPNPGVSQGRIGKPKKSKSNRVFSPLVITVMVLGGLFLGAILLLKTYGGIEGVKAQVMNRIGAFLPSSGGETGADGGPATPGDGNAMGSPGATPPAVPAGASGAPASATTPPNPASAPTPLPQSSGGDNPPPGIPVEVPSRPEPVPQEAPAPTPTPTPAVTPTPKATPAAPPTQPVEEPDPLRPASTPVADTPPAPMLSPDSPPSSAGAGGEPAQEQVGSDPIPTEGGPASSSGSGQVAETPSEAPPSVTPQSIGNPASGGQAAAPAPAPTVTAADPSASGAENAVAVAEEAPVDPGKKMAAILEPIGMEMIESFYRSDSIDERAAFVIDPDQNQPRMEAYYRRYQQLPTLRKATFRGPMRDAASGRWFGVFDVFENENEENHRWCVVQVRPGELKLDWVIYQQLIDESLDRFLADPASPPKEFRLVIRRGEQAPSDENPWPGITWELQLTPPLDTSAPRTLLIKESEMERLGLESALIAGNARIGRVELGWVASDLEPLTRVPTVTKVLGWGAW